LASQSMKDAATCDNSYELQNQAYYQSFERIWAGRWFQSRARRRFCADNLSWGHKRPLSTLVLATKSTTFKARTADDHPLNLSISLSGGKENNCDSLSSGERRGKSPSRIRSHRNCGVWSLLYDRTMEKSSWNGVP